MKYLELFESFENEEIDYDLVRDELKGHGWGDLSPQYYEEFEESSYYSGTTDSLQYAEEMNSYLHDTSFDDSYEEDESLYNDDEDEDSQIDLSIELEHKLRNLPDDSDLSVDDFLEEVGVDPKDMTGFAWASILKNRQPYEQMSDEEFKKLYDEYKNSSNESYSQSSENLLILESKNRPTNPSLWAQCKAWAKSKYDVWPSAYACGAAAKRYKSKGGKWKKKKSK